MSVERITTPPLPPDVVPLANQVSGHFYGQKASKLGLLELTDGCLVKPLIPPKGEKEKLFYCSVFQPNCGITDDVRGLIPLLPKFYGLWSTPLHTGNYIKLENITKKFIKPCIMDIKVGPHVDKSIREMTNYHSQKEVGFRLVGIKVYHPSTDTTDEYYSVSHIHMKGVDVDEVLPECIMVYLDVETNTTYKTEIIKIVIIKLKQVLAWFSTQTTYRFYASSLLLVYEGVPNDLNASVNCQDLVDIRLIDFTHVYPAEGKRDENYIIGVSKLLYQFEDMLKLAEDTVTL